MNFVDWIGATGVFLILLAYLLNLVGKVAVNSVMYILLNLVGSSVACVASILLNYMPFIILEAIWALVSFYTLIKILREK